MKDVGISCCLLAENATDLGTSITGVESYLVRQLKLEYNELSNITRKINAYTKDILNNLAAKCRRKDRDLQKLVRNLTVTFLTVICFIKYIFILIYTRFIFTYVLRIVFKIYDIYIFTYLFKYSLIISINLSPRKHVRARRWLKINTCKLIKTLRNTNAIIRLLLQHVASKRVMASQYTDETGNPCLKLRFRSDKMEKKCQLSKSNLSNNSRKELVSEKMYGNVSSQLYDKLFSFLRHLFNNK